MTVCPDCGHRLFDHTFERNSLEIICPAAVRPVFTVTRIPWKTYGRPHESRRIAELLANRLIGHVASVKVAKANGGYQLYTRKA